MSSVHLPLIPDRCPTAGHVRPIACETPGLVIAPPTGRCAAHLRSDRGPSLRALRNIELLYSGTRRAAPANGDGRPRCPHGALRPVR
jgi:hypothetical protein